MKPCSKNRKLIAWLALDALDARKAAALRDHLARCEGCRHYWQEISNTRERLASAGPASNLEASDFFHHRVAEKLRAVGPITAPEQLAVWLRSSMLSWRAAVSALAVLMIALFVIVAPRNHPTASPPVVPAVKVLTGSSSGSDLAPTVANYEMVANESLDKLSELLTRQGNKRLPPAPVYTASGLQLANASF
jgi:hypothetical protein